MNLFLMLTLALFSFLQNDAVVKENELMLLPKPQYIRMTHQKHHLHNGGIGHGNIKIEITDSIPGVRLNQDESYKLEITQHTIKITATTDKGVFWAHRTLEQIMESAGRKNSIPTLEIIDYPAFRLRGFMHDIGRSYMSVEEIKKHIRLLSKYKINTFHWHLTENQGWRLESKRFPQLNDSINFERHFGQYYTLADAHEIYEYCRQHNMMLIPEIDMPGHSAAFVRAMGVDMQSEKGIEILKILMEEICTEVFPDVEYIHIGTDEVQFTNKEFVPQMVAFIRYMGKKVISWNPGWNYQPGEIDMTQLWSYRGKAQPGIPAIDSRFHYINHFDAFGDIVALYNSKILNVEKGSEDMAGSIMAIWNDRLLPDDRQVVMQNNFYPAMLAFAERTWRGGGSEYYDKNGTVLPIDNSDPVFHKFVEFEKRLLWHKQHAFRNEPFAYVKQTNVKWYITDAFPNFGDLKKKFPPEDSLSCSYTYDNRTYNTQQAIGAGIYLRHVWGSIIPSFYENPLENHTAYAYTWVWSPIKQKVGLWATTQDYSRSEADLPPPQGKWDYRESRIFINDKEIAPPLWQNTHTVKSNEVTLKNENFSSRPPLPVSLNKGWNKVLLKLPIGKFSTPEVRLQKWMFNFVFVTPDGSNAVEGLIYSPEKKK